MYVKGLMVLFISIILSGCATTKQPLLTNFHARIERLEGRLGQEEKEISALREEVQQLSEELKEDKMLEVKQSQDESNFQKEVQEKQQTDHEKEGIIRVGVSSEEVQKALMNSGFYEGDIDGKIGNKTKQAISNFQRSHKLVPDGIVGRKTWAKLKLYLEGKDS